MAESFYELLGVAESASREEIKRAYRRAVRRHHPDVSDAPDATERLRRINRAYRTLSNPEERSAYDRLGHETYVARRLGSGETVAGEGATVSPDESTGSSGASGASDAGTGTDDSPSAGAADGTGGRDDGGAGRTAATSTSAASRESGGGRRRAGANGTTGRGTGRDRRVNVSGDGGTTVDVDAAPGAGSHSTERTEREMARVRRRMRHRRVVARHGEPALALATLVAFAVYAAGVRQYFAGYRDTAWEVLATLVAAPTDTAGVVAAGSGLGDGAAFAVAAAAARTPGLFFPVGAAVLPVVLFASVANRRSEFRHAVWWLLPLLGSAPAAALTVEVLAPETLPAALTGLGLYGIAPVVAMAGWVTLLLSRI